MIRNFWYAILQSKELKKNKMIGVTRLNEKLVLWRSDDNSIHCISDLCAHRGVSLSIGKLVHDNVQCPFHGLRYDGTGKVTLIPANGKSSKVPNHFKVHSYAAREEHGFVWIFWGDKTENLPDIPFFDNLDDSFHHSTRADHWNTYYTRAIENQLDEVHVPFVHHNTIGRGGKTLVHGPLLEIGDNELKFYPKYDIDVGQKPMKPEEFPKPGPGDFYVNFVFPNIWQNHIFDKLRIFTSFTPIDDENTLIYMRIYQKILRVPLLQNLVTYLNMKFSMVVLHQDRRVVITEKPKKTSLKMNEKLIPGDSPIIAYRRIRDKLLKQNNKGYKYK
ncbi:Rieske 2Fe-2S domain-containing protein [Spirochaetota bacterium]